MSSELAAVIVLGLGCAANPWGIMMAVLLLDARRGHGIVWTYVAAWVIAIGVVLAALVAGLGSVLEPGSHGTSDAVLVVELILGLVLLVVGLRRILEARRAAGPAPGGDASAPPALPGWLRAIENISYVAAFLLGIYSATYPLVIAAAGEILRAGGTTAQTAALVLVFVAVGSSSVVAVATFATLAPTGSSAFFARLRAWLVAHNRSVITAILLLFGAALTARGLAVLA